MGLIAFIKNLFSKKKEIEISVEKFVNEVEVIAPKIKKVAEKNKTGIAKSVKAKKTATKK